MRLSVALCTYQGERFLDEQLESIARQTRPPDEMVVCDDRSVDGSTTLVSAFAKRTPIPVRLLVNERRLGCIENFQRAISMCSGDAIVLADQDDRWHPSKLERLEAEFTSTRRPGLVFSDGELIDEAGARKGLGCWQAAGLSVAELQRIQGGETFDVMVERGGRVVTGATMAFLSRYRDLVVPFPKSMPRLENSGMIHDGWIAILIAAVAPVSALPERLISYRIHAGQHVGFKQKRPPTFGSASVEHLRRISASLLCPAPDPRLVPLMLLRDRLGEHQATHDTKGALALLRPRLEHLETRCRMAPSRLSRLTPVLRELASGRYGRYSNGWASATKDLLVRHQSEFDRAS